MALPNHFRMDRQRLPSFYFMASVAIAIGFFFIACWALIPYSGVVSAGSDSVGSVLTAAIDDNASSQTADMLPAEKVSSEEPEVVNGDGGQDNRVEKGTVTTAYSDKIVKEEEHAEVGQKQQRQESVTEWEDDELPTVTAAAQSELTTSNNVLPTRWSTQRVESTEEKDLVGVKDRTFGGSLGKLQEGSQATGKQENEIEDEHKSPEKVQEREPGKLEDEQLKQQHLYKEKRDDFLEENNVGQREEAANLSSGDMKVFSLGGAGKVGKSDSHVWKTCNWLGATDYIPCLDNQAAIRKLKSRRRFQHRERHCPLITDLPLCLTPLPQNYRLPIRWPLSRDQIWFNNVPHPKLVSYKKDQNWMNIKGEMITFPGGGTQFKTGASRYIDRIEKDLQDIQWGKHTRVVLDVGAGVASFGGYLFERQVLTMSFAPKDEHEAQVQLALERGIPAIVAVMGTQRLAFPSNAYDMVHCARCRVHWHGDGGILLMEVNRVLRPGGYFVWSATPVYRHTPEDSKFWNAVVDLAESICWKLVSKTWDAETVIGIAIFQKPFSNSCYERRTKQLPPICDKDDMANAAWYVPMQSCIHKIPTSEGIHAVEWPVTWPERLDSPPSWLNNSGKNLFGQPASLEFQIDAEHWKHIIHMSYLNGLGIDWSRIRNVMDMNAGYGGFAAALIRLPLWVLNVVPVDEPDTLPAIFDRGLFGIYHDWCESFSTYPRTYDLLHADHIFKRLSSRCNPNVTVVEMDRVLRPEGWVIFREKSSIVEQIDTTIRSLEWDVQLTYAQGEEKLMVAKKGMWRPEVS